LNERGTTRGTSPSSRRGGDPSRGARTRPEEVWRALALPLFAFFLVPIFLLFSRIPPGEILESLQMAQVSRAIGVSLRTTLVSLLIIVISGTPLAYLLGRYDFRFKRFVDTVIDLPTVLPPSVAGVALLVTFGRRGFIGAWLEAGGIQVAFTPVAVVLAQVFIAAPFFVRTASVGFGGVEAELEQAAQLDGATRWQVFRYVILPLSRDALISGSMMSWARALGEFGATILFAGNLPGVTQTMPIAIYLGFEVDLNIAITLSMILVMVSFGALLLVKGLLARWEGD